MGDADENPYESPAHQEPQKGIKTKAVIGAGVILLLTPLAVIIALGVSCGMAMLFVDATLPMAEGYERPWSYFWFVSALAVFTVPPAIVLFMMLWWARQRHLAKKAEPPLSNT